MRKLKIVCFIGIVAAVIIIPVCIFATNISKTKADELLEINTVVMGSDSVEVFKEKSREEITKEKIENSKQYQSNEDVTYTNDNTYSDINNVKSKEVVTLEKKLENIAKKYNKYESFESITSEIEKQGQIGKFTDEHRKLCELFLDIYEKEDLIEEEKNVMKEFFEMVQFNNIDLQLEGRINTIIK